MENVVRSRSPLPFVLGGCLSIGLSYLVFFFDETVVNSVTGEDGLIESLTAIFFFLTSILFAILYARDSLGNRLGNVKTKRNIFFLLLAIVFFFGAGEEISWGQRIFNIETPELFMESNAQHEINIHNLDIFHGRDDSGERKSFWKLLLNIDRLFSIFWFTFCVLTPIAYALNTSFRAFIAKINLPVIPIPVGLLFMANYLISKVFENLEITRGWFIVETKEYNTAFLFFMVSLYFLTSTRSAADPVPTNADSA